MISPLIFIGLANPFPLPSCVFLLTCSKCNRFGRLLCLKYFFLCCISHTGFICPVKWERERPNISCEGWWFTPAAVWLRWWPVRAVSSSSLWRGITMCHRGRGLMTGGGIILSCSRWRIFDCSQAFLYFGFIFSVQLEILRARRRCLEIMDEKTWQSHFIRMSASNSQLRLHFYI